MLGRQSFIDNLFSNLNGAPNRPSNRSELGTVESTADDSRDMWEAIADAICTEGEARDFHFIAHGGPHQHWGIYRRFQCTWKYAHYDITIRTKASLLVEHALQWWIRVDNRRYDSAHAFDGYSDDDTESVTGSEEQSDSDDS